MLCRDERMLFATDTPSLLDVIFAMPHRQQNVVTPSPRVACRLLFMMPIPPDAAFTMSLRYDVISPFTLLLLHAFAALMYARARCDARHDAKIRERYAAASFDVIFSPARALCC